LMPGNAPNFCADYKANQPYQLISFRNIRVKLNILHSSNCDTRSSRIGTFR
jgi:hypothetical protein